MNLSCPHCTQPLELTPEVLAELAGSVDFPCPECGGAVPLPVDSPPAEETAMEKPVEAPADEMMKPAADMLTRRKVALELFQQANRRVLILGSAAMLVLGGVAGMLVHHFSGNRVDLNQDITNEILKNKFFTDLIASGATTMEQLRRVERIEAHGPGFIGLSREELTWEQAQDLARATAARMLPVETPSENRAPWRSPVMQRLVNFLEQRFPAARGRTVWVMQNSDANLPQVFHAPDVSHVTTRERPRRVFLHWMQLPKAPDKGANVSALRFEGRQAVVVQDHADFHEIETRDELSIEAWIRVHRLDRKIFPILDKSDTTDGFGWYFELNGDTVTFTSGWRGGLAFKWQAPLWQWCHVAFSYRRTEGRAHLYVNGRPSGEVAFNAEVQPTTETPLYIGRGISGVNEFTIGDIDEVRLWKRALSADEVLERYQSQLKGDELGLVGCWRFDEGSGSSTRDLAARHNTSLSPAEAPPVWETSVPKLSPPL